MIWSPSTTSPAASTARQRSASPSWAMPTSAPCSSTAVAQAVEVGGADAVVDVEAVGVGADHGDLGARRRGTHPGDGAAAAPWAQSSTTWRPSSRCGSEREQVHDVAVLGVGEAADPADARRRSGPACARPCAASMRSSTSSGSLGPPRGEELDAVVGHRVVRRGDHDAEVGVEVGGQEGDGRRREDAGVAARRRRRWPARRRRRPRGTRRRPAGRGRRRRRAGGPDARARASARSALVEHGGRRLSEARGASSGRQRAVGEPTDTVGAEKARHQPQLGDDARTQRLRVLRSLAGLLETGLLALLDARVAGQEAGLLERRTVVLAVDLVQRRGRCRGAARRPGRRGRRR